MRTPWLLAALGLHAGLGGIVLQMTEPHPVTASLADDRAPQAPALQAVLLAEATLIRTHEQTRRPGQADASAGMHPNAHSPRGASRPPAIRPEQAPGVEAIPAETVQTQAATPKAIRTDARPEDTGHMDTGHMDTGRMDTGRADPVHAAAAASDAIVADVIRVAARPAQSTAPPAALPRVDASWAGNTPPPYPLAARRQGVQGKVQLDLLIETDGAVSDIRLRESSGSSLLDRSVMQTVKRWRFIPASQQGQTIAAWYPAWEWVFRLEEGS